MGIAVSRILHDVGINVLKCAIVAPIKQVEECLGHYTFRTTGRLKFLYFAARHVDDAVIAECQVGLCQAEVNHWVVRFKLCSMCIGDGSIPSLPLCQGLSSTLQVGLY